jgi:hypothetical protein
MLVFASCRQNTLPQTYANIARNKHDLEQRLQIKQIDHADYEQKVQQVSVVLYRRTAL